MKYFVYLFTALVFISCEKVIDMEIPDKGRRPVINGLISDGGVPEICLHRSRYILDNSYSFDVVNNALVIITYPGGISDTLKQLGSVTSYKSTSPLSGNGNFTLYVAAEGYQITAKTDIPAPVPIQTTDTSTMVIESRQYFEIDMKFNDPPGTKNYYMAEVQREGWSGEWYNLFTTTSDMNASGEYNGKIIFSDELFNGLSKTFRIEISKEDLTSVSDSVNLMVNLYSLSYDSYMYMLTVEQSGYNSPFTEPVVVYSNIKEGYGIFAGYSVAGFPMKVPAFKGTIYWE